MGGIAIDSGFKFSSTSIVFKFIRESYLLQFKIVFNGIYFLFQGYFFLQRIAQNTSYQV